MNTQGVIQKAEACPGALKKNQ